MRNSILPVFLAVAAFSAQLSAQQNLDDLMPIRGFCIGAPRPKDVDAFIAFIDQGLRPRHINTLILRVEYSYQYQSRPEMADPSGLSKEDVKKLVAACKAAGIQIIPEIDLLGHQSFGRTLGALLRRHPEFDETPNVKMPEDYKWPNADRLYCKSYCPLHPAVHEVVFALMDELCDAFESTAFHAGMDEVFYIGEGECPRCSGRDKSELFAGEVRLLHDHLAQKGRKLWIWGDRLLPGKTTGLGMWEASYNDTYRAVDMIPKDIMICDWHYDRPDPTPPYFALKGLSVVTCPWKSPQTAVLQTQDMIRFRNDSAAEMKDRFQGMVQTVWSDAGGFLRRDYGGEPKKDAKTSWACLTAMTDEITRQAELRANAGSGQSASLGLFSNDGDIGKPAKAGAAQYFSDQGRYVVTGGGANMWFTNDAYHFVWRRMTGDLSLAAAIKWVTPTGVDHRKACLIIRQSLDPDSAYADAVVHGNGLTSLQFRESTGAATHEIVANVVSPGRVRIEKRGNYVSMSFASEGEAWRSAGGSFRMTFKEPFYIGLGVCAHDDNALQECAFTDVQLTAYQPVTGAVSNTMSTLEYIGLKDGDRHVIYPTADHIEAPNWSRDGKYLVFNGGGKLYKLPAAGGQPQLIDTGLATRCNNDHGFSPDGTQIAISGQTETRQSLIYIMPVAGGALTRITAQGPSYWHGWSPDGKTLAFCGQRSNEFDIYTIPVEGGNETRLTTAPGLDDGPDYSPDGKFIYFNSERTGLMQIWRMAPDGSNQEQVTSDGLNNWFPHPSPDGKWIAFLTFPPEVKGHPANKDVTLRLLPTNGGPVRTLTTIFGGQGTMNVPSWSPESGKIAFVSYQPVYPSEAGATAIQAKP